MLTRTYIYWVKKKKKSNKSESWTNVKFVIKFNTIFSLVENQWTRWTLPYLESGNKTRRQYVYIVINNTR